MADDFKAWGAVREVLVRLESGGKVGKTTGDRLQLSAEACGELANSLRDALLRAAAERLSASRLGDALVAVYKLVEQGKAAEARDQLWSVVDQAGIPDPKAGVLAEPRGQGEPPIVPSQLKASLSNLPAVEPPPPPRVNT